MAPIHKAAREGNVAALRRILAGGVSPDVLDDHPVAFERMSPLLHLVEGYDGDDSATDDGRVACFELLRDAGANLEARLGGNSRGSTVLHYAAKGYPRVLSLLVEAGVNVNAANESGYTPLHWAARGDFRSSTDCLEVLLKAGAAVNVKSNNFVGGPESFKTPFDVALKRGNRRMWPLFLRAGAEMPNHTVFTYPYIVRVRNAGGFKKYEQAHLARITAILAPTPLLPPELVRKILEFWLHAGYY